MADRSPKTVRCDDDLWDELAEFAYEEEGKKRGSVPKHLENAIREYLDKDRSARIESKLDEVLDHVRDDDATHTHKHGSNGQRGSETVEKVRQIADRVYTNHSPSESDVIPPAAVERAIEDIAGADPRTIEKYTNQLKRRQLLFQHPGGAIWTDEKVQWVAWCEKYLDGSPTADVHDITEEYDMTSEEYNKMADEMEENGRLEEVLSR